ncbi:MAG TPA: hypothetical protein VNO55_10265, partial [Polyangia bacterium]|nr:hypothetical protein [Polyangia bacterium]
MSVRAISVFSAWIFVAASSGCGMDSSGLDASSDDTRIETAAESSVVDPIDGPAPAIDGADSGVDTTDNDLAEAAPDRVDAPSGTTV